MHLREELRGIFLCKSAACKNKIAPSVSHSNEASSIKKLFPCEGT